MLLKSFLFRHSFHPPIPEMAENIETWLHILEENSYDTNLYQNDPEKTINKIKRNPYETSDFFFLHLGVSWGMYILKILFS